MLKNFIKFVISTIISIIFFVTPIALLCIFLDTLGLILSAILIITAPIVYAVCAYFIRKKTQIGSLAHSLLNELDETYELLKRQLEREPYDKDDIEFTIGRYYKLIEYFHQAVPKKAQHLTDWYEERLDKLLKEYEYTID